MSKSSQLQILQQRRLELGPRPGLRGGTQGTQGIPRHPAEEVGLDPEGKLEMSHEECVRTLRGKM